MNIFLVLIEAAIVGIVIGFLMSIPLGPSGIESVKRTISKGYLEGFRVSIGAVSADVFYILLINAGLLNILSRNKRTESLFWIISGLLLVIIGYNSMKNHFEEDSIVSKYENKKSSSHPYITGFIMTATNPMTPSLWLTISSLWLTVSKILFKSWYQIGKMSYYVFIVSIILGMVLWFALLNFLAYKGFNILSPSKSHKTISFLMWTIIVIGFGFIIWGMLRFFDIL